jgi:hypothetical protein
MLLRIAKSEKFSYLTPSSDDMLSNLIEELCSKYKNQTVILVNKYNTPISDNFEYNNLSEANSELLKYFYSSLKNFDQYLRFAFVTGVTHYALMGLSDGMDSLVDITVDLFYSNISRYTLEEFDYHFNNYMKNSIHFLKYRNIIPEN